MQSSPQSSGITLHMTELHEANGVLTMDRNAPAYIHMPPQPINNKSDMMEPW
jgi:hypothetical protein